MHKISVAPEGRDFSLPIFVDIITYMTNEERILTLAQNAIERLQAKQGKVVRICGPLTSGNNSYEHNLAIFKKAEKILIEKGFTVFDYFTNNHDEEEIYEMDLDWETVMDLYHKPILAANILDTAFFLPGWEESNGATWEHDFISKHTKTKIKDFPVEWLTA